MNIKINSKREKFAISFRDLAVFMMILCRAGHDLANLPTLNNLRHLKD